MAEFDGGVPSGVSIGGDAENDYEMALGVSKTTTTGGKAESTSRTNPTTVHTTDPLLLNPYSRSSVDFFVTQPLLQGAGRGRTWRRSCLPESTRNDPSTN